MALRAKDWLAQRWPTLLSAALMIAAFPPFNAWPLIFVALVPMFRQLRSADRKQAWRIGYLFGLIFFLDQLFWLDSLATHWTHSPMLGLIPWIIGSLYVALHFGWAAVLVRACYARNWLWLIPVAWAGVEVCRSYVPVLAFPWGLAATPLYRVPILIQTAHFGTIYLVSAGVVVVNVMLAAIPEPADHVRIRPLAAALLLLCALSLFQIRQSIPADSFAVTIGQPGVNMAFGDPERRPAQVAANVDAIAAAALTDGSRLLVLPEGIVEGTDYPPAPSFQIDKRLPVLFGGQHGHGDTIYQTAFSFDGRWHFADKTRLVIFGEFVPGRTTFPFIAKTFKLANGDLSASKNGIKAVEVAGVKAGPMLCFEGLFPEVSYVQARNGSRFISVMCIDDWYMGTSCPEQLMAGSIFRAVETGLPLVRSASMGYTIAVDAHGNIIGRLPLKEPAGLRVDIELPKESPLFPFVPVFPVAAFLVALTLPLWPGKKRTEEPLS